GIDLIRLQVIQCVSALRSVDQRDECRDPVGSRRTRSGFDGVHGRLNERWYSAVCDRQRIADRVLGALWMIDQQVQMVNEDIGSREAAAEREAEPETRRGLIRNGEGRARARVGCRLGTRPIQVGLQARSSRVWRYDRLTYREVELSVEQAPH